MNRNIADELESRWGRRDARLALETTGNALIHDGKFPFGRGSWIVGANYAGEWCAPVTGYMLPFDDALDCLGWLRWWVLTVAERPAGTFVPADVALTGDRAEFARILDESLPRPIPSLCCTSRCSTRAP